MVQAGAKTHGGGLKGGCLKARYCSSVLRNVPRSFAALSESFFGLNLPGCDTKPDPSPKPTGSRMEMGVFEKIDAGNVRPGT